MILRPTSHLFLGITTVEATDMFKNSRETYTSDGREPGVYNMTRLIKIWKDYICVGVKK